MWTVSIIIWELAFPPSLSANQFMTKSANSQKGHIFLCPSSPLQYGWPDAEVRTSGAGMATAQLLNLGSLLGCQCCCRWCLWEEGLIGKRFVARCWEVTVCSQMMRSGEKKTAGYHRFWVFPARSKKIRSNLMRLRRRKADIKCISSVIFFLLSVFL